MLRMASQGMAFKLIIFCICFVLIFSTFSLILRLALKISRWQRCQMINHKHSYLSFFANILRLITIFSFVFQPSYKIICDHLWHLPIYVLLIGYSQNIVFWFTQRVLYGSSFNNGQAEKSYNQLPMLKKLLLLILLVLATHTKTIEIEDTENGEKKGLPPGSVRLIAINGDFLRVCSNCGGSYADSASVQPDIRDNTQVWTLERVKNKVAFKGSNGLYLSRCNNCWEGGAYADSAFVHLPDSSAPYSQWTPQRLSDGKYAFLSDNGLYLAPCNNCAPSGASSYFAFVHMPNTDDGWSHWDVQYVKTIKKGKARIQTDLGFLRICPTCGGAYPSAVSVQNVNDANTIWKIVRVGEKVAFQGSNGNYLSRCNNCWSFGFYPDSAFAHLNSFNSAQSQWTPILMPNGKWSFRADNGNFLSRCLNCADSSQGNLAFVHATGNSDPYEQFSLIYLDD